MGKTNVGRGASIIAGALADMKLAINENLAQELSERIATALDKAEARGRREDCEPQFDAEKVKRLINVLSSFTYCAAINVADCGDLYLENARLVKRELLTELGIGE